MPTVDAQIKSVCNNIDKNIVENGDRSQLSQNILSQLRNLVEALAVRLCFDDGDTQFHYDKVKDALNWISNKGTKDVKFLITFHKLLNESTSHYTLSGETSERLMLKYYEYLYKTRVILNQKCNMRVLENLEQFPVNLDPSLNEYYNKIVACMKDMRSSSNQPKTISGRFYIRKVKPFFIQDHVYYEITFQHADDHVSKFERNIAFSDVEISDDYAVNLSLVETSINVLDRRMPILLVSDWVVSIRPCEFRNFARIFGITDSFGQTSEYKKLMGYLSQGSSNLLGLMDMPDEEYRSIRAKLLNGISKYSCFSVLDKARAIISQKRAGTNVLRYLMLHMNNRIIKLQYCYNKDCGCPKLSGLQLSYGCIPFDDMPFCTSLIRHNPEFVDVARSIRTKGREDELLARVIKINAEQNGKIYTPVSELIEFGNIHDLIESYNSKLYYKHRGRRLIEYKDYVFQSSYEDGIVQIVRKIKDHTRSGVENYKAIFSNWLSATKMTIDDDTKKIALQSLFSRSQVALIYGAAGTGKTQMVSYVADMFKDKEKLFLAHTNPAKENLQRRVSSPNSVFRTISSQNSNSNADKACDLLFIDECSTVDNSELLDVLEYTQFSMLVLVGDVYQIESIRFGNWFSLIRKFVPKESVFELENPYRTKNDSLIQFWSAVRGYKNDLEEIIAQNGYSKTLDESLFKKANKDEIILCLNYDGLYGINNINRFLQGSNPNVPFTWGIGTYKVNDPILFTESSRFKPFIYNNLKGRIVAIKLEAKSIQFDIWVDREINEAEARSVGLILLDKQVVRFSVSQRHDSDDDIDSDEDDVVPFQVAYAVSIHKSQGLEYNSVKVVITDANEDDISHSIFYTAITRAREKLQIFWTPETEHRVIANFSSRKDMSDYSLLKARHKL